MKRIFPNMLIQATPELTAKPVCGKSRELIVGTMGERKSL